MPRFLNPFSVSARDCAPNAADVVIPLSTAHRQIDKNQQEKPHDPEDTESVESGETWTLEALKRSVSADTAISGHDELYDRNYSLPRDPVDNLLIPAIGKSKIINKALQDIGMGRYQWELFTLCGFGWFADNLWLQGLAIILPSIQREFDVPDHKIGYTTTSLFIGLCIGATVWGVLSDIVGRRIAFNTTLFIAGVFGLVIGAAPNWIATAGLFASLGTGIGGNLPVDGALFLEFLPGANGGLLTLLSIWWPVGQLVGSLIAWGWIPENSCEVAEGCLRERNMGWRYTMFTCGAVTFIMVY